MSVGDVAWTWVAVYPTLTAVVWALEPLLGGLPLPVRTAVTSAVMVPVVLMGVLPLVRALRRRWATTECGGR